MRVFAYDVQSIHDFLFESLEFKAIYGASRLVDRFDQEMKNACCDGVKCLYTGGGTGIFTVVKHSDEWVLRFKKLQEELLLGHPVVQVELEFDEKKIGTEELPKWFKCKDLKESGNFPRLYARVALELEKEKQKGSKSFPISSISLTKPCPLCGNHESELYYEPLQKNICQKCDRKIAEGIDHSPSKITFDLDKISKAKTSVDTYGRDSGQRMVKNGDFNKGYIGVIYGDGNSLGTIYQRMNTSEEYSAFSKQLRETMQSAIEAATRKLTSYAVPLLGGDDFFLVVPPQSIFEVLKTLNTAFEKIREQKNITFSFGMAILPTTIPLKFIFQMVEDLQDEAKKQRTNSEQEKNHHYVAFQFFDQPLFSKPKESKNSLNYGIGMQVETLLSDYERVSEWRKGKITKGVLSKLKQLVLESSGNAFWVNGFYYLMRNTELSTDKIRNIVQKEIKKGNLGTLLDIFLFQENFTGGVAE